MTDHKKQWKDYENLIYQKQMESPNPFSEAENMLKYCFALYILLPAAFPWTLMNSSIQADTTKTGKSKSLWGLMIEPLVKQKE